MGRGRGIWKECDGTRYTKWAVPGRIGSDWVGLDMDMDWVSLRQQTTFQSINTNLQYFGLRCLRLLAGCVGRCPLLTLLFGQRALTCPFSRLCLEAPLQ